jgi:hypothetical protein
VFTKQRINIVWMTAVVFERLPPPPPWRPCCEKEYL